MKSIGAEFLRPVALPGINHVRGMQYQIVLNIPFQGRSLAQIRGVGQCLLSKYRYQVSIPVLMLGIQIQVSVPIQSKCVCRVSLYIEMKLCILSNCLDN